MAWHVDTRQLFCGYNLATPPHRFTGSNGGQQSSHNGGVDVYYRSNFSCGAPGSQASSSDLDDYRIFLCREIACVKAHPFINDDLEDGVAPTLIPDGCSSPITWRRLLTASLAKAVAAMAVTNVVLIFLQAQFFLR